MNILSSFSRIRRPIGLKIGTNVLKYLLCKKFSAFFEVRSRLKVMACFVEGYVNTFGIKLYVSVGKKRRNNGKIADTIFEGEVLGIISDVNSVAAITCMGKRT